MGARRLLLSLALAAMTGLPPAARGAVASGPAPVSRFTAAERAQGFREGVVLARPHADRLATVDAQERAEGTVLRGVFARFGGLRVLETRAGESTADAVARLGATGRYDFVEPDYIRRALGTPNDPDFPQQWGLRNTGTGSGGGLPGADIHATAGWDIAHDAPGVIVAVIDTGVRATHQDLAANLWVNPSPGTYMVIGGTGYYDSLHGLNAIGRSGAPDDDVGHGTHVSGIIGAVGNNGTGVCGVAWKVQIMALKFLDATGGGTTIEELACIDYAISKGASVINASFGSQGYSQSEMSAIQSAGAAGIIFVVAAGNNADDNDVVGTYPAGYPLDNIVCVGASDNFDRPASFSDRGAGSVDLFAPGQGDPLDLQRLRLGL